MAAAAAARWWTKRLGWGRQVRDAACLTPVTRSGTHFLASLHPYNNNLGIVLQSVFCSVLNRPGLLSFPLLWSYKCFVLWKKNLIMWGSHEKTYNYCWSIAPSRVRSVRTRQEFGLEDRTWAVAQLFHLVEGKDIATSYRPRDEGVGSNLEFRSLLTMHFMFRLVFEWLYLPPHRGLCPAAPQQDTE